MNLIMAIWFAVSIPTVVIGQAVFYLWLKVHRVQILFFFSGTPGYPDYVYIKWCLEQGRRPNWWFLAFRVLSLINAVIASLAFSQAATK
jgi:hypothetical protein